MLYYTVLEYISISTLSTSPRLSLLVSLLWYLFKTHSGIEQSLNKKKEKLIKKQD